MLEKALALYDLNIYEHIPRQAIAVGLSAFLDYTNEKEILAEAILEVIHNLKPSRILDVGAGRGDFLRILHKYVDYYIALEPDTQLFSKLDIQSSVYHNTEVHKTTLEQFETSELYDLVVSCHTLSYFKDKKMALTKMASLTSPRGHILLILHSLRSEQLNECLSIVPRSVKSPRHLRAEELVEILKKYGYKPQLSLIDSYTLIPTMNEWLKLSYFFTRHPYNCICEIYKKKIRDFFIRHGREDGLEIRATHGLVLFNPHDRTGE